MGSLGPKLQLPPGSASSLPTAAAPSPERRPTWGFRNLRRIPVIAYRSPHLGSGSLLSGLSPSTGDPYRSRRGWQWTLVCVPSFQALGQLGTRDPERGAKGARCSQPSPRLGLGGRVGARLRMQGLERDRLFLCLGFPPTRGAHSSQELGPPPHCFRGSHSASHPPRAVEIGVLCGLLAGSGPLGLRWEGSWGEPAPGWGDRLTSWPDKPMSCLPRRWQGWAADCV